MSFQLEISYQGTVQSFPFSQDAITLGRDKGCHLVFDHPTVSRQHARIVKESYGGYTLHVLSQSGLTAVNGTAVQGTLPLQGGETINLGQMSFVFRPTSQPAPGAQAPPSHPPAAALTPSLSSWDQMIEPEPQAPAPLPPPQKPKPAGGYWDQAGAEEEEHSEVRELSDYEKMQRAQQKGEKSEGGTNPLLLAVGALGLVAMMYMLFFDSSGAQEQIMVEELEPEGSLKIMVECSGAPECESLAESRFSLAKRSYEHVEVRYENAFDAYKAVLEGKALLEQGKLTTSPSLKEAEKIEKAVGQRLDRIFKDQKIFFKQSEQALSNQGMWQAIDMVKSTFQSGKSTKEYKWAMKKEQELNKKGITR